MVDVQCQACTQFSKLPDSMGAYEGPWTCPNCNARHRIKTCYRLLLTNSLEDRFTIDQPKCSIEKEVVSDIKEAVAVGDEQIQSRIRTAVAGFLTTEFRLHQRRFMDWRRAIGGYSPVRPGLSLAIDLALVLTSLAKHSNNRSRPSAGWS